jgi:hypothetical protein
VISIEILGRAVSVRIHAADVIEAIWNRGDLDVADELFAPGFVNHNGLIMDLVFGPQRSRLARRSIAWRFQTCMSPWRP